MLDVDEMIFVTLVSTVLCDSITLLLTHKMTIEAEFARDQVCGGLVG